MRLDLLCCGVLLLAALPSNAQSFPARTVRLIVPFPAGGSSDIVARLLGPQLAQAWNQEVQIDNRPGGASVVGTQLAVKAAPDGHTLVTANVSLTINEALRPNLPYSALRDLIPITLVARQHTVVVAHPDFPAGSIVELVELAKSRPPLAYYSSGPGSVGHLAGALLGVAGGCQVSHASRVSGRRMLSAATANPGSFAIIGVPAVISHVRAGKLKALAVTDGRRADALPDVPTVGETLPGFEVNNWIGILAPYGISVPLVRRIHADIVAVVRTQEFHDLLASQGDYARGSTPGEFKSRLTTDIERFTRHVSAAGVSIP
jgi:tripartite-type tricarboxylate transporter receptor subunit TctC